MVGACLLLGDSVGLQPTPRLPPALAGGKEASHSKNPAGFRRLVQRGFEKPG